MSTSLTFIVGPTATGKTNKALELAQSRHADILSADSRQVYAELPITSGADLPEDFDEDENKVGGFSFYSNESTRIYGIGMLSADQEWSIAHFRDYAEQVLAATQQSGKSLIIVGGSGLYIRSLFLDKQQLHIQPNATLREEFAQLPLETLQTHIRVEHPELEQTLNHSDWNNPRRLIRWLEKRAQPIPTSTTNSPFGKDTDHEWLVFTAEKEVLHERIVQRVKERVEQGAISEVQNLLERYQNQNFPALSTLGVKEIRAYLFDQLTTAELIELWSRKEFQYAKRQLTWFKKYQPNI